MGSTLNLIVPEHDQREAVIRAYYEYVLEKTREIRPELDRDQVEELSGYRHAAQRLDDEGRFFVYETLSSTIAKRMDIRAFEDAFKETNEGLLVAEDPTDIEMVIDFLREAKAELIENPPVDVNWEYNMEAKTIALCEFALEHGYGVEYSY